ncbi:hypothetical protein ANN_06747 [Periplaneta americana]|uniref:Uncharacterized protein n=1 Tax=Periplaneta americana TaxID=6978 RepID=A0ABQ8TG82_PERAM|nr:hypothetical protein ANN_06747 [Periplaneta americana]
MSPGSSTESYPAFARIGLRENPGKNLNQVTCPDRDSNPGHLVSQSDALTVTPQRESKFHNHTEQPCSVQCYLTITPRADDMLTPHCEYTLCLCACQVFKAKIDWNGMQCSLSTEIHEVLRSYRHEYNAFRWGPTSLVRLPDGSEL